MGKNKKKQVVYDDFEEDYKKKVPKEKEKDPPEELNYMTEFEYKKLRCKTKEKKAKKKIEKKGIVRKNTTNKNKEMCKVGILYASLFLQFLKEMTMKNKKRFYPVEWKQKVSGVYQIKNKANKKIYILNMDKEEVQKTLNSKKENKVKIIGGTTYE